MAVRTATIDVIGNCQNRCSFCYNKEKKGALNLEKFKTIIEAHPSLERINIGGGEPFLNQQLPHMVGFLLLKGLRTDISTNCLVHPRKIILLGKMIPELLAIQVNFPAVEEKAYDSITGTSGGFGTFIDNIKTLAATDLKVRLRLTLCRENIKQLGPAAAFAKDVQLPLYVELAVPLEGIKARILTPAEAEGAYFLLLGHKLMNRRIHIGWDEKTACPAVAAAYGLKLDKKKQCAAETGEKIYIDQFGRVAGCEFLEA